MSHLRPSAPSSRTARDHADLAVRSARFIDPGQSLSSEAEAWRQRPVIGLDTEFVRERTFYPRPGLIQLYDSEQVFLIDPIGRSTRNELTDLMKDQSVTKVFHSVGEDLEVMQMVCGEVPDPLFDTQIAAALLGYPLQSRYEALISECFDVELAGGQARSDWCKRPLAQKLLDYAASDVVWLIELQKLLSESLEASGRLSWLIEDCQRLVANARGGDSRPPLLRVKGAGRLDPQGLGWLDRLSAWREEQAHQRDLPRSFIIKDDTLIDLADEAASGTGLGALAALPPRERQRYESSLSELLSQATPSPIERPIELQRLEPDQRQTLKNAQIKVRKLADSLQIDPALLASKRALTQLLFGETPDWAEGWRKEFLTDL
jgi:ribonuclease D